MEDVSGQTSEGGLLLLLLFLLPKLANTHLLQVGGHLHTY